MQLQGEFGAVVPCESTGGLLAQHLTTAAPEVKEQQFLMWQPEGASSEQPAWLGLLLVCQRTHLADQLRHQLS